MANKLKVAIYDNDYKIRKLKNYDISQDGNRISIVNSGAGKFMPTFDNTSFLEFPSWRKWLLFGERSYKRLYIVKNKGEKCVNFSTGEATGPSTEDQDQAVGALIATKLSTEGITIPWYLTLLIVLNLGLSFIMAHVLGVF